MVIGNKKLSEPYEDEVSDVFRYDHKAQNGEVAEYCTRQSFRMVETVGYMRLKTSSSLTFSAGIPSSASDVSSDAQ